MIKYIKLSFACLFFTIASFSLVPFNLTFKYLFSTFVFSLIINSCREDFITFREKFLFMISYILVSSFVLPGGFIHIIAIIPYFLLRNIKDDFNEEEEGGLNNGF